MKKEPEVVQCPKAKNGKCFNGGFCSHSKPHVIHTAATICHATGSATSRACPACEPIKPKNVTALLKSIAHWDLIAQGLEESWGAQNCECCIQFNRFCSCTGCLIYGKGFYKCRKTPCKKVLSFTPTKNQTPEALNAIEAEVEFLVSCLPETEQKAFSLENIRPFLRFGDKVWRNGEEVRFIRNHQLNYFFGFEPKTNNTHYYDWTKIELSPPKPKPQLWKTLKVGQPVVVKNRDGDNMLAFFQSYNELELYPITIYWGFDLAPEDFFAEDTRLLTRAELLSFGFDLNRWQWADDEIQKGE